MSAVTIPPPGDPTVEANPDTFYVGDDPISGNVMANDTGGATYAVLQSHPGGGRITSFEFDGTVQYQPGFEHGDTSFTYVVFKADGSSSGSGSVSLNAVNMDIYDGQNGTTRLSEQKENKFGALTVANRNDTDSDYTKDNTDNIVQAGGQAYGEDEKDLMRLAVHQPKAMQGNVTISSNNSAVYFYNNPLADLNGLYGTTAVLGAEKFDQGTEGNKYAVLWVEARQWSTSIADITITMTYGGVTENAKATAIWAEMTAFHATGWQGGSMVPASEKDYRKVFDYFNNSTGKMGTDVPTFVRTNNNIKYQWFVNQAEMEFTLRPAGIGNMRSRVKFDTSRSSEMIFGYKDNDGKDIVFPGFALPPNRDMANDDQGARDEAQVLAADHLYVQDSPNIYPTLADAAKINDVYKRMNAFEFVRVLIGNNLKFDHPADRGAPLPPGTPTAVQGSRASELYDWHSFLWFQKDAAGNWVRPVGADGKLDTNFNEMDRGTKPLV